MFMKLFMTMKEMIVGIIMKYLYLGLRIPDNLPFKIIKKVFMVMG